MGVRDENRERMTEAILDSGRRQLAEVGPGQLSLRAVARELGVASSAVYRYVASRDELLTRLIVAAYDDLGAAVEKAEAAVDRADLRERWRTACSAVRDWGRSHPNEWALVYGSPVPGYAAPDETIGPAARVPTVLAGIVADVRPPTGRPADDRGPAVSGRVPADGALPGQLDALAAELHLSGGRAVAIRLAAAWTHLVGTVSLELFGHLVGTLDPADEYWAWLVDDHADRLDLP